MQNTVESRATGLDYDQPECRNVAGTIQISITHPQAVVAGERFALPCANVEATMAGFGSVGGVDQYQFYAVPDGLVGKELAQLVEGPRVSLTSLLRPPHLDPLPDARQILQGQRVTAGFGIPDEPITDGVVEPPLKAPFPARQPLLELPASAPTRPCALRGIVLGRRPNLGEFVPEPVERVSTERLALAGHGDIPPTQVDADHLVTLGGWRWDGLHLDMEIVVTVGPLDERGTGGRLPFEQAPLVVADAEVEPAAFMQQPQANGPVFFPEGKDPAIIIDTGRPEPFDHPALGLGRLAVACHSGNGPGRQVG